MTGREVVPEHTRAGEVLAGRYRLTDLLTESAGGRFWRAFDSVLQRDVAVHIIACDDARAPLLRGAARTSATVLDRRMLRVLDIDETDDQCFVVNEWGSGTSLDILLAPGEPLPPAVAAWIVAETADTLALAHEAKVAHGRLVPENILIDTDGAVRLIGFAVDAALHGLPPGRISTDIADLAGLLYAGSTARWAGVSSSVVAPAPSSHGHVLRPRQVRAGIPRTLDSLCDHVLNHGGDTEVTAAMVADSLRDFLGTSAGAAEAWLARLDHPRRGQTTIVLPPLPDPPPRSDDGDRESAAVIAATTDGQPGAGADTDAGADTTVGSGGSAGADSREEGLATQAGMPIFHEDTDEVTWLRHHTDPSPPPPPFEPPPERPLFAPEPADGQPVRRPRAAPVTSSHAGGFWPWDNTGPGSTGAGTGSGLLPPYVDDGDEDDDRPAPGASMLRLAGIIAACLVVLVASVVAFNLGRGKTPLGTTPHDGGGGGGSHSPSATATTASPITGVTASDFDPQGSDHAENPTEAHLAVDGNTATAWQTSRYDQQFGPAGLKTGVGLVLDLGGTHDVSKVAVTTLGAPTSISVYVLPQPPTSLRGAAVAGRAALTGTTGTITLNPTVKGRYVVLWLTRLPVVPGGFRGGIAEAVVSGD